MKFGNEGTQRGRRVTVLAIMGEEFVGLLLVAPLPRGHPDNKLSGLTDAIVDLGKIAASDILKTAAGNGR